MKKVLITLLVLLAVIFLTPLGKSFRDGFSSSYAPEKMIDKAKQSTKYDAETLELINEERAKIGVDVLETDENLCSFAEKLSAQLTMSLDDNPQVDLATEMKDPSNVGYLADFSTTGLTYQGGGTEKRPSSNLAQMFTYSGNKAASSSKFTHGCVADSQDMNAGVIYTVFIGGEHN